MSLYAVGLDEVSIIDGLVPVVIYCLTAIAVVLGLGWRSGIWRRQVMIGIPGAVVITAVGGVFDKSFNVVGYDYPSTFYVWVAVVVLCIVAAVVGWPGERAGGRVASLLAVPLSVILMGQVVNAHYAYYPTIAALSGKVSQNEATAGAVEVKKVEVKNTRILPPHGNVLEVPIPGPKSGFVARNAYVYLPPAYFADPTPELPVIMMLHGSPGDPANWTQGATADVTADAFAAANGGKVPILVTPDIGGSTNGDTECVDGPRGNVETYLMTDVMDLMHSRFNAATGPSSLAVVGLSTGGTCSLVLSLRNPDKVVAAGDYSGTVKPQLDSGDTLREVFGGDQKAFDEHDPSKILLKEQFSNLGIWFESGVDDTSAIAAQNQVAALAHKAGIETCVGTMAGGHDFTTWSRSFAVSLPWLSGRLGLTPPPAPVPTECTR